MNHRPHALRSESADSRKGTIGGRKMGGFVQRGCADSAHSRLLVQPADCLAHRLSAEVVGVDLRLRGAAGGVDGFECFAGGAHPGVGEGGGVAGVVGRARLADVGSDAEAEDQGAIVAGEVVVEPLLVVVVAAEGAGGGAEDGDGGAGRELFEQDALQHSRLVEADAVLGRGGEDALAVVGTGNGLEHGL